MNVTVRHGSAERRGHCALDRMLSLSFNSSESETRRTTGPAPSRMSMTEVTVIAVTKLVLRDLT